jgi:subtilisin family serine protease
MPDRPRNLALTGVAVALLLLAFGPSEARAQLRGLGGLGGGGGGGMIGSPGIGGVGPSVSGLGNQFGVPSAPDLPGAVGSDLNRGLSVPSTGLTTPVEGLYGQTGDLLNRRSVIGTVPGRVLPKGPALTAPNRSAVSRVPPATERRYIANEVLLGLPSNLSNQALDALARRHRLTRLDSQRIGLTGTTLHRWQITNQRTVSEVIRAIEADRGLGVAQPNYQFTLQQDRPPPELNTDQYVLAKLHVSDAHRLAAGAGIRVAVIDGGIDVSHPELAGNVADAFDAFERPEVASLHGTGMAGAIAAHARLTGIAPEARILAVRAFASGNTNQGTTLTILKSIDWAIGHGARVINMSFAGPRDPEISASLAAAAKKGVILLAAAGNAGPKSPPLYPAADPNVIAVTATDADDRAFIHSNRGRYVAIAAPGVDVLVPAPGGMYQFTTGTSVATALVSGIAALMLERDPSLTTPRVKKILSETAKDLGPKGRDDQFGAGLADAYRAVQSVAGSATASAPTNVSSAH